MEGYKYFWIFQPCKIYQQLVQLLDYYFSVVNNLCEVVLSCPFGYSFHWLSQVFVEIELSWSSAVAL